MSPCLQIAQIFEARRYKNLDDYLPADKPDKLDEKLAKMVAKLKKDF